jgi:hypothetical protein
MQVISLPPRTSIVTSEDLAYLTASGISIAE